MSFQKKDYREIVDSVLQDLSERSPLSDANIGSVTRTLVESIGAEISTLYEQMENAYNAGFVDTAEGKALDLVVSILGVARKSPQYATGSVTFSRRTANKDVTIPRGTRLSTRSSDLSKVKLFETTITTHLPRGQNSVEIPVKALIPGEEGVADFETITDLESPIIGVDKVLNKKPTTIGSERETDEELRARAKATVLSAGKATVETIRNAVLGIPGVRSVAVIDMPEGVPGEIDVIIDGLDLTDKTSHTYMNVVETIEKCRPIGILVNIKSTTLVRVNIDLFVKLKETIRTDEETENVIKEITELITDYLSSLKTGDQILRNRIISSVLTHRDVYNVDEMNIKTKIFDEKLSGMVDDTRKRTDRRTLNILVGPYERVVVDNIAVFTQYTPKRISYVPCSVNIIITLANQYVSERKVKDAIESALVVYLERLKPGEEVEYNRIFNLIKNIEGVGEVKSVLLSAFYEESGVIIGETKTNIKIGEQESPKLGELKIEVV